MIADARPDAPALVQGDRRGDLGRVRRPRRPASPAAFGDLGVGPDAKVASYLYNCSEYLEGTFATWKLRAAPVNVNYRYLEDELPYLLENSDAEVLLFHGSLGEHVAKVRDRAPAARARSCRSTTAAPLLDGALDYEELVGCHEPMPSGSTRSGDDLYILYTGGTTGMPKGVMWRNDDLFETLVPSVYSASRASRSPTTPDGIGRRRRTRRGKGRTAGAPPGVTAHARHRVHVVAAGAHVGRHDRDARAAQLRRRTSCGARCSAST